MSKNAYAIYLGISEKAVRNAVLEGKIKKGYDTNKQKIIKHLADKEYGHLHSVVKPRPGVSKDKLSVRMSDQDEQKKNVMNSDKSEQKQKRIPSPKITSKKSEENVSEDEDEKPVDLNDYTYDQLIEKIKITPGKLLTESWVLICS